MKKLFCATIAATIFFGCTAIAQDSKRVDPQLTSGGNAFNFPNHKFPASSSPSLFRSSSSFTADEERIRSLAKDLMEKNPQNLSFLLVDNGRIIFEGYQGAGGREKPMHSMSMSKSITAYLFGTIMCEGKIASLNDRADKYAPRLKGSLYGETTIRNLLMMASGQRDPGGSGDVYNGQFKDARTGVNTSISVLQRFNATNNEIGFFSDRVSLQGTEFVYLNTNTQAIAEVINSVTHDKFFEKFNQNIWSKIGAEYPAYWMMDKEGSPIAYAGLNVSTRDYARLAQWTLNQIHGGSCIADYLRTATKGQIPIHNHGKFDKYGFQTWTKMGEFWWIGYGGQRVGVDPKTRRIVVATSTVENYMPDIYRVFSEFKNMR